MDKKIVFDEVDISDNSSEDEQHYKTKNNIIKRIKHIPWVEKYRVKRLKDILGQEQIIELSKPYLKTKYSKRHSENINQNLPHLIFYGPPGTGKTSSILSLAYELFGPKRMSERILELNASDNKGINFVRGDIKNFSKLLNGTPDPDYPSPDFKIIILDEADSMTPDAQAALRKSMEETAGKTKFCIICNYDNKIIEAIKSRCVPIYFKPLSKELLVTKLKYISKNENIKFSDDIIDIIVDISEGDARNAINILQHASYISKCKGSVSTEDILIITGNVETRILKKIWHVVNKKTISEIKNLAVNLSLSAYNVESILKFLAQKNINAKYSDKKKSMISIKVAETDKRITDSGDEMIQLLNVLIQINLIIKNKIDN